MANEQNLKPFKKGDPRINRKGRPKSFDKLRELAQQIANEPAINAKTGEPLVINGHIVTQIEAMLRLMVNDKKARALFLEYAYGKPKQQHELSGAGGGPVEGAITLKVVYENDGINDPAKEAAPEAD